MGRKKTLPATETEPATEPVSSDDGTVQTVQPPQKSPWFELSEDEDGEWYWCLWASNGRQMAISPTGYNQQADCRTAIESFNGLLGKKVKIAISHPSGN